MQKYLWWHRLRSSRRSYIQLYVNSFHLLMVKAVLCEDCDKVTVLVALVEGRREKIKKWTKCTMTWNRIACVLDCFLMFVYRKFKNSRAVSSILRTFVWSRITWLPLIHGFSFRLQRTSCIEKIKSTIHVLGFYYGRHDNHQILLPVDEIRRQPGRLSMCEYQQKASFVRHACANV